MKLNIKCIICIGLIILIFLLTKCKESFHPIIDKTSENLIDLPLHNLDNINYDNYIIVGDGIKANISDNILPNVNKINVCNECKTQKCDGLDCLECDNLCSFTENNETTMATMATMATSNNETTMATSNNETTMPNMDPENNEPTMPNMDPENNEPTMPNMDPEIEPEAKYAIISIKDFFRD
jgi:hypothetical protein